MIDDQTNPWPSGVMSGLAILISLGALYLSWLSWTHVTASPKIAANLPKIVRLVNQPKSSINSQFLGIIIQPTYTLLERTDETAVIVDVTLAVQPPEGAAAPSNVAWLAFNTDRADTRGNGVDPAPIVVAQDRPQAPHLLFAAYGVDPLTPGVWKFTLTAHSTDNQGITKNFCVDVASNWAGFVNRSTETSPLIPIFRKDLSGKPNAIGCYRGEF